MSQSPYGAGNGVPSQNVAQNPAFGGPVHADAPTGTIPPLVTGTAAQRQATAPTVTTPAAGPSDAAGSVGSGGSGAERQAPVQSGQSAAQQAASRQPRQSRSSRAPRRAKLQLRNINPWTVLKFSCVLSIALFFVWLIVVGVLFGILDAAGVIGKINDTVVQLQGAGSDPPVTAGVVFGSAAIIGVVNIVLFIALTTVGSVVYNLCADLVGGVEVTLSER